MLRRLGEVYEFIQVLSLDVVAGAIIGALFLAKHIGVILPHSTLIALGSSVWIIYTVDHLLDAQATQHKAHTLRHRFHQKFSKQLTLVTISIALLSSTCLWFLPSSTLYYGLALCGIVGCYFVILKVFAGNLSAFKELSIAIIYTIGIFIAPISLFNWNSPELVILCFLQYLLLACINLFEFSLFDEESDKNDGHSSVVSRLGKKRTEQGIVIFLLLFFSITAYIFLTDESINENLSFHIVFFLMGSVLSIIFLKQSFFKKYQQYRILGDAVFLLPIIDLLL